MMDGNKPLLLTILAAALFIAVLLTSQPYSADSSGGGYAKPARGYIRAALQQDSLRLARLSASASPVAWALRVARMHRESLVLWEGRAEARTGARSGDTTEVFLYPFSEACSEAPIQFRFVGSARQARVVSASSRCLDQDS
jgi:hypothetical protein